MKKLMMICALLFAVVTFANAQQGGGRMGGTPEERTKKMVETLTEKLKLTDDQKTKVSAIYTEQATAMTKIREEANGDRDAMREKSMKLRKDTDEKVNAVLTDDQKTAYKAWQEEQRAAMQNRQGGGQ
ncbi:hypothetical protein ACJVDH_12925 [Pedobacter sp. AW1-32]|uniref:hypothetical protein n=1 Tax=Pedobacter sp. AW1-32 TaxID=3383026 RepID=UPI003FEE08DB